MACNGHDHAHGTVLHVICPQREGAIGGSDLHVIDLAVIQRRHGYLPLVLAPRVSTEYRERLAAAGLEALTEPLRQPRMLARLPAERHIGIVHAHGYEANYLIAGLRAVSRRWRRLPAVVTAHGWIETTPWLYLKSALDRLSARAVDVRITSASAHAPGFRRHRRTTIVVHNGIPEPDSTRLEQLHNQRDILRRDIGIPPHGFVVGSVGRLCTEKRIDLLLTAAAGVLGARPDLHVLVVGGGSERAQLEALAQHLGIRQRVVFTGLLSDPTPAYTALDVLVQPSDTEGTPRTILEAMALGVPVIATEVGDVATMLDHGHAGILIEPDNAHKLADAINRLIDQPELRTQLAERARRQYRECFTVDAMHNQVAAAYDLASRSAAKRNRSA